MFRKVLVPLDGSPLAERAIEPALAAADDGGEVTVLEVAFSDSMLIPDTNLLGGYSLLWPGQALARSERESRAYLEGVSAAHPATRCALRRETVVEESAGPDIAQRIVAAAAQADLIVMSSHGYTGLERWFLGSVTERVLSAAPCPVLVLREGQALDSMLIPLDGSSLAEAVLAPGLALAERLGAKVTLLQVVPDGRRWPEGAAHFARGRLVTDAYGRGMAVQAVEKRAQTLQQNLIDAAKIYLNQIVERHRRPGRQIETRVEIGPPAERLLAYADASGSPLIAMATHGYTGLKRWRYGSVTQKVLHGGRQAMLIVRSH